MYNTKLTRYLQKIFGSNSQPTEKVDFGTPTNGRAIYATDPETIQTDYYEKGWFPESLSGNIRPYAEDMNALHYVHSYQLAYILQAGVPEWNKDTPYFKDCIVRGATSTTGRILYVSNQDNNIGNPPDSDTAHNYWDILTLGDAGIPVGASLEWNGVNVPSSKWHFEDGSALLKASYPELFAVIGYTFGGSGDYFNLPNSSGRVAVGYQSGTAGLSLGNKGGQFNHQHLIPSHFHGKGNLNITSSGTHTHAVTETGHSHVMPSHQHCFRFGDFSAGAGSAVSRLSCLGSSGSGSSINPRKVAWNAQNGSEGLHFYKMTSQQIQPSGSIDDVGNPLNTSVATSKITLGQSSHVHSNANFSGVVGNSNGTNGDNGLMRTTSLNENDYSSNMPFIVKRKIIRVLP